MVHFPGFARTRLCIYRAVIRFYRIGFPHSEIPGSMPTCGSPRLIAACHVLHRLLLPRHPPCALSSLTTKFTQLTSALRLIQDLINFMMLFVPAHRSLRLLRTAEPQQESKALIKLTLCYSPCSYPMLFNCQKSPALRRPTLGGLSTSSYSRLPKVRRQATGARYPLQKCTVSLLTPNLKQLRSKIWWS